MRRGPAVAVFLLVSLTPVLRAQSTNASLAGRVTDPSKALILDPEYEFVILDELNIVLRNDTLLLAEIVEFLATRPLDKHICITGRDAKPELLAIVRGFRNGRRDHKSDQYQPSMSHSRALLRNSVGADSRFTWCRNASMLIQ